MPALTELVYDQAWLVVTSYTDVPVDVLTQSTECTACPPLHVVSVPPLRNSSVFVANSTFPSRIVVRPKPSANVNVHSYPGPLCDFEYWFGEYGSYQLNVSLSSGERSVAACAVHELETPVNSFLPMYVAVACLAAAIIVTKLMLYVIPRARKIAANIRTRRSSRNRDRRPTVTGDTLTDAIASTASLVNTLTEETPPLSAPKRARVYSLDVFRGFIILAMIFVNTGGGSYWFFEHATWHGLTFADLIFPWFMFIMGVAIVLSFRALQRACVPKPKIAYKIIRRSVILFLLGLMVNTNGGTLLPSIRIPGVLQRFSIAFLVVGFLEMLSSSAYAVPPNRFEIFRDFVPFWPQWLATFGIATLHTLLTFLLPVPGCPTGYIGPGGLDQNASYVLCTGGAAGYIDRLILGSSHIYQYPTCRDLYQTQVPYDPEGILGVLMSIVLVVFGVQAGRITYFYETAAGRLKRFCAWGFVLGLLALLLCNATKNTGWIPVNKNLWSLSFILATGSLAFFILALLYLLVDQWHVWSGAPLFYPGSNAIALYFGSEMLSNAFPFSWQVPKSSHAWLLFMSIWTTTMWFLVSCYMYHKKVFITV